MNEKTPAEILQELENTPKAETIADQWQSQIYARALSKHKVIAISGLDDDIIRAMKLIPAHSLEEALTIAGYNENNPKGKSINIIPQGISAIIH